MYDSFVLRVICSYDYNKCATHVRGDNSDQTEGLMTKDLLQIQQFHIGFDPVLSPWVSNIQFERSSSLVVMAVVVQVHLAGGFVVGPLEE